MATTSAPASRLRSARRDRPARRRETIAASRVPLAVDRRVRRLHGGPHHLQPVPGLHRLRHHQRTGVVGTANFQQMIEDPRVRGRWEHVHLRGHEGAADDGSRRWRWRACLWGEPSASSGPPPSGHDARGGRRDPVPPAVQRRFRHRQPGRCPESTARTGRQTDRGSNQDWP